MLLRAHDYNMDNLDTYQTYVKYEGLAAAERVRRKILAAAAVAAGASTIWSMASERKFIRTVPSITANTAIGATTFAICQEAVRAARQGDHDAWNSFWAGGIAGAALTRAAYGRGFHLLGMVMWAPLCGSLHWLNDAVQPSYYVKSFLASNGLLDLPQQQQQDNHIVSAERREEQQLEAAVQPRRFEDLPYREKKREVELIRQRELQQLNAMLKEQERQQQQDASKSSTEQQETSRKWSLFR